MKTIAERRAYHREYRRKNPDKYTAIAREKRRWNLYQAIEYLGGVCKDCGYKENLDALQFDHLRDKVGKKTISQYLNYKWESIVKELDKCELVCANCHAIRTAQRRREKLGGR